MAFLFTAPTIMGYVAGAVVFADLASRFLLALGVSWALLTLVDAVVRSLRGTDHR